MEMKARVLVIGAGPAGLTAAVELGRHGVACQVLEADDQVGGISRTVVRNGWRFDIGGHRFFTKVPRVEEFWREILPSEDFLMRPRMSRIFYRGRLFDYPLKPMNALRNLGFWEATRCVASYFRARVGTRADQTTFEGWVAARFGWRLYRIFFKTYTEKVWGVPATEIQADWAAQRIKNLSLGKAVVSALMPRRLRSGDITSLIEEFKYPKLGPGMMWEECALQLQGKGSAVRLNSRTSAIRLQPDGTLATECEDGAVFVAEEVISSMPIGVLVQQLDPAPPPSVLSAARRLRHRDFLTVALVVPARHAFPDNWIYIHSPEVEVGRIQNFGSWSPYMVKDGRTCLGLEYFVNEGDELWEANDDDLVRFAAAELESLGLAPAGAVEEGFVVRMPAAYPVYDTEYEEALSTVRDFLGLHWPQVHPVGRNGMHRYNNQDHSMLTAMLTVDNITLGTRHDVWEVNVEEDYHEERVSSSFAAGTGRQAPVLPVPEAVASVTALS